MRNLGKIAAIWAISGFALTAALTSDMQAEAQAVAGHNTSAPVTFDAGNIALDDRANRVVLTGGVVVNQSGLTVRSNRMLANYSDDGSLDVDRITANGGVVVTRGNERASGDDPRETGEPRACSGATVWPLATLMKPSRGRSGTSASSAESGRSTPSVSSTL